MGSKFPDKIELCVDVRDGKIARVGPYRHGVDWDEDGPSTVTYCNNCGFAMIRERTVKKEILPVGETRQQIYVCAQCGIFQGFVKVSSDENQGAV